MDKEDKKNKAKKTVQVGDITIEMEDNKDEVAPSATEIEKQLREGGIEVVEGKKSLEENDTSIL
jgi:hypothetical protein